MLDTVHTQKLLSLHQRSDNQRWQMTYERQQSRRQQMCRTCFCVVAFDITKRVLHLELTFSFSKQNRMQNRACLPSARRRFPNNSKPASLGISSSNGYSSMVPFTGKLAVCLRAVRMQRLLRCADSKTHARSHYTVPWGLVVRASLSSQSKSNSYVHKQACLCDWRGFPPCLVTTGGLKEMITSHSVPMGRVLYYLGFWNGAWPRRVQVLEKLWARRCHHSWISPLQF